jgi:hypothetical protein
MNPTLLSFLLALSFNVLADVGDMGGGRLLISGLDAGLGSGGRLQNENGSGSAGGGRLVYSKKLFVLPTDLIEGFISAEGSYTKLVDIQDGIEELNNVTVTLEKTIISIINNSGIDIKNVLLIDGRELEFESHLIATDKGDMGGG